MNFQTALQVLYPPRCLSCGVQVDSDFGLCGACWRDTPFIGGLVCDACGTPLPGEDGGGPVLCDDCIGLPRPWAQGRAALEYRDNARKMILGFKHGDRQELARPAARWMARAACPILAPGMLIAPVPLHWSRMLRRRFNQAALLAHHLGRQTGLPVCPDLLRRTRRTRPLEGVDRAARFALLADTITVHPRRAPHLHGRPVLLVDDVMTSGATLSAATDACLAAGAAHVRVIVLARVAKNA